MHRERVSENVYWFQSEVYAQVTAGAVTGSQWAVVIDTLAMPEETLEMRSYIEEELGVPVRYVINTHYHADHSWGNCFFPAPRSFHTPFAAIYWNNAASHHLMLPKNRILHSNSPRSCYRT